MSGLRFGEKPVKLGMCTKPILGRGSATFATSSTTTWAFARIACSNCWTRCSRRHSEARWYATACRRCFDALAEHVCCPERWLDRHSAVARVVGPAVGGLGSCGGSSGVGH